MFKRRTKEPTAEDAPDSLAPWQMLEEEEIADYTARLHAELAGRNLTAFARRLDRAAVAAFDKGPDGAGKAVVVREPDGAERPYPGFGAWFDAALAEHDLAEREG